MDDRRYSIKEIQRMTQLSPLVLQELINKYREHLNITTNGQQEGEEWFIDHASFERLIFLKQLELRQGLSPEEIVNQLAAVTTDDLRSLGKTPFGSLKTALDDLSFEVSALGTSLQQILNRYSTLVKEVNYYRGENRELKRELDQIRIKQNLIIEHMKKEAEIEEDEKGLLN